MGILGEAKLRVVCYLSRDVLQEETRDGKGTHYYYYQELVN